jgi:hypothetical protein
VVFGVFAGEGTWGQAFAFLAAVGLGNTLGGVVLVALLNFGQTRERRISEGSELEELNWRDWLFGFQAGLALDNAVAPEVTDDEDVMPDHDPSGAS